MVSLLNAWKPNSTISRLMTLASTGRRMNGSVNAMEAPLNGQPGSVNFWLAALLRGGCLIATDGGVRTVSDFWLAAGPHLLARFQSLADDRQAASPLAGVDKTPLHRG